MAECEVCWLVKKKEGRLLTGRHKNICNNNRHRGNNRRRLLTHAIMICYHDIILDVITCKGFGGASSGYAKKEAFQYTGCISVTLPREHRTHAMI